MTKFQRKTKLKADAILTADWHIRTDTPICRTDDFFVAMESKIDFILDLSEEHDCPILIAGDVGHKPQWQNWLLEWAINKFEDSNIICIPGQHDLPNHRIDLFEKSGMGVLTAAGVIDSRIETFITLEDTFNLISFPYSAEFNSIKINREKGNYLKIAITHQMVIENKPLWPGQEAPKGNSLLKKFPCYDLILSGDNHNPFVAEYQGRKLVNPGSLMRTTADQENHRPRVYLWYAENNEVEPIYLPIEKNVISRTHIDVAKERDNRNQAFIERVNNDVEIELSYENNLEAYFNKYRTQQSIKDKVWVAVE